MIDIEQLKSVPALSAIEDPSLVELAAHARAVSVPAGTRIGGDLEGFHAPLVIKSGTAWLLRHGHRVAEFGPGKLLTDDPPRNASLVAATPMRVIQLRREDVPPGLGLPDGLAPADRVGSEGVRTESAGDGAEAR
jgi:hypothetical protein